MCALSKLGWSEFFAGQITEEERAKLEAARVVAATREQYRLASGNEEWRSRLAGRLRHAARSQADLPVVGDWVLAAISTDGTAILQRRLERKTALTRGMAGRATAAQPLAANVDAALLVTSCDADFNPRRLERYLALAWESGATPVIVLTKADLANDADRWREDAAAIGTGVPVLVVSAVRGDGMDVLRDTIRRSGTTVLLGSSGVGKSTLLNALLGEERQRTLPVREHDSRGRHSTTSRELFLLPSGGIVIDTPGMRALQMWDAHAGLDRTFADIEDLAEGCRFSDCRHVSEPGCAVRDAIDRGVLSVERLESYQRLLREDEYVRSRDNEQARAARTRHAKQISRAIRQHEKMRRR